jgi:hypothetical protein
VTINSQWAESVSPGDTQPIALRAVANKCAAGSCPTVYESGAGTLVVQGYVVSAERAGIDVPSGEMLVEIPFDLLAEAMQKLS